MKHEGTLVVNVRDPQGFDVYIGRNTPRAADKRCQTSSLFANPYKAGRDASSVEETLMLYERYMRERLHGDAVLRAALLKISGLRWGCWCKPDPCHGDVLWRLLDELVTTGQVDMPA